MKEKNGMKDKNKEEKKVCVGGKDSLVQVPPLPPPFPFPYFSPNVWTNLEETRRECSL